MNIMKTNMLLLDNKFMKDDAGNATQAPVPSTEKPEAGMKALSFLGMKNLMTNPGLAMEVGVMNDKMAEKSSADSYVAPYSSNIAFQGSKFSNAAKLAGIAAATVLAGSALTSCEKEWKVSQEQTVIVDVTPVVEAVNALRAEIAANNAAQTDRDKEVLEALQQALVGLTQIQTAIQAQTLTIDEFKELVLGKMVNGELQRSAILDAIITLQNITEKSAIDAVTKILAAFEAGQINFQQAMAQIQGLLQENNNLLANILDAIDNAVEKASKYAKALLKVAIEIDNNGKASVEQQSLMIEQNNLLIQQNNIQIAQGNELLAKADEINMSIQQLTTIAKLIGKSLEEVMVMSKNEIISAINKHVYDLQNTNNRLNEINNNIVNNTISIEDAAKKVIELLGDINANISDIKAMLAEHFGKYDIDMAELKSLANNIKVEQTATTNEIKKLAISAASTAADTRNVVTILNELRKEIKNGNNVDLSEVTDLLKRINADQTMTKEEILAKMDAYIANQEAMANKLDTTNDYLSKLGFVVSNDVINAINNIGDNLEGLDAINANLKELLAAVKSLAKSFDLYAKNAVNAHNTEISLLTGAAADLSGLKGDVADIKAKLGDIRTSVLNAELQRNNIESYLKSLLNEAEKIEQKLGRIPTIEEFDAMLTVHDKDNQEFYAKLIKDAALNPADFSNIEELLKAIKGALVDFQGTSNKLLADILAKLNTMDTTSPDYNEKLDKIIDLLKNFKCECNCQCDCDNNQTIHEGIIDIIS